MTVYSDMISDQACSKSKFRRLWNDIEHDLLAPRAAPGPLFDDLTVCCPDLTICRSNLTICRSNLTICRPDLTIWTSVARISWSDDLSPFDLTLELTTYRSIAWSMRINNHLFLNSLPICLNLMHAMIEQFTRFLARNLRNRRRFVARRVILDCSGAVHLSSAHSVSVWTYKLLIEVWQTLMSARKYRQRRLWPVRSVFGVSNEWEHCARPETE